MKKLLSLFTALLLCTAMWGAESSFYNLPKGAFGCGMSTTGGLYAPYIQAPYFPDESPVWTSTTGAGNWIYNSTTKAENSETYTMSVAMKKYYYIPVLEQEGKTKFQFGIKKGEEVRTDTRFRVGDSIFRYITPALIYTDLVSKSSGQAHVLTKNYNTINRDVMGVYFNNVVVMCIDGISIPIKNNTSDAITVDDMFPSDDAHVIVNIYKATAIGGQDKNQADKTTSLWTGTLTKKHFSVNSSATNTGALNMEFGDTISIDGSFVVELSDMKTSGCKFYVYSSQVHSGTNDWGYYIDDEGAETYPGDYTLAVSVHAMFPVLYGKSGENLSITIPSTGAKKDETAGTDNRPRRNIYANYKYKENADGWSFTKPDFVSLGVGPATNYSTWYFSAEKNNTDAVRSGDFKMNFRGKTLTYTVTQAPMIKSISIKDSKSEKISALSIKATETATLFATISPTETDQTSIMWSVNDATVASIKSKEGGGIEVTAEGVGTAIITAKSVADEAIFAICTVTVTPKVEAVNVPTSNLIAPSVGGDVKFTKNQTDYTQIEYNIIGKNFDANDWEVTFNSDCDWLERTFEPDQANPNRAVITLKATEKNETESSRTASVTIKAYNNTTTFSYSISQAPMIKKINGLPTGSIFLKVGGVQGNLSPSVYPGTTDQDKTINLSSSDDGIATITEDEQPGNYKIIAVAPGTATITAKSVANEDVKAECTVTVYEVTPEKDPTTTTLTAQPAGGETTVAFTLSGVDFVQNNWLVTEKPDWITETAFTSTKGDNSTTVTCTLTAAANATGSKRDGEVTITAFSANKFKYTITQESLPSAFYEVPEGAFFAGMTNKGAMAYGAIYLPYKKEGSLIFSSVDGAGNWWSNGSEQKKNQTDYTYSNLSMNSKKTIPQLRQEGKVNYQYGGSGVDYDKDHLFFYVGNSDMQYMTPAKLWCDLTQKANGQAQTVALANYKTTNNDVMGVYFNNTDVMYIDGISIPINSNTSGQTVDNLFPETNSHVKVNIYKATAIGGKMANAADRSEALWSGTLTKDSFDVHPSYTYRGALNATFEPISIDGPFVVELSDMKNSGCAFYIYSAKERDNCNYWGYCSNSVGLEAYPLSYTLAVSVHAMFPALYTEESLDVEIPAEGSSTDDPNCPTRTIYANHKYNTRGQDGWDFSTTKNSGISVYYGDRTDGSTVWKFIMSENTTNDVREGDVTFTFRGKKLTYHVTQAAAPTTYTRDNLTAGEWGTICLPWASTPLEGATFYNVLGTKHETQGIALEEIDQLVAGKPYVFKATSNKIIVTYDSKETPKQEPINAGNHIIGTFMNNTEVPSGKYIIYDNKLYKAGTGVTIDKYRAYFDVDNMDDYNPATAPARVVFFGGSQSPTDNPSLHHSINSSFKVIRDGQLLIIRDGKTYNAQGIEL